MDNSNYYLFIIMQDACDELALPLDAVRLTGSHESTGADLDRPFQWEAI